jgi:hypothetical protein
LPAWFVANDSDPGIDFPKEACPMTTLADIPGEVIPLVAIGGTAACILVGIVTSTMNDWAKTKVRERTRREVAAYVAEGSMTPDEAERILKAGNESAASGCGSKC